MNGQGWLMSVLRRSRHQAFFDRHYRSIHCIMPVSGFIGQQVDGLLAGKLEVTEAVSALQIAGRRRRRRGGGCHRRADPGPHGRLAVKLDGSPQQRLQRGPGHAHRGRSERGWLHPDPGGEPVEHRAHLQLDPGPRAPLRLPLPARHGLQLRGVHVRGRQRLRPTVRQLRGRPGCLEHGPDVLHSVSERSCKAALRAPGLPNQTAGTVDVYGLQILDATLAAEAEEDTAASARGRRYSFGCRYRLGTASNLVMYVSAADNDYVGVTGTFLGTASQGVWSTARLDFLVPPGGIAKLHFGAFGGSIPGLVQQSAGTLDLYSMQIRASAFEGESVSDGPAGGLAGPHGLGHAGRAHRAGQRGLRPAAVQRRELHRRVHHGRGRLERSLLRSAHSHRHRRRGHADVHGGRVRQLATGALTGATLTITGAASTGPLDCESLDCTFTATSGGVSTGSVVCGDVTSSGTVSAPQLSHRDQHLRLLGRSLPDEELGGLEQAADLQQQRGLRQRPGAAAAGQPGAGRRDAPVRAYHD